MSFQGSPLPSTSTKNAPLSPAAQSLGLGDQLQTQLQDELDEAKKKKMANQGPNAALNPNTPGISSAVQSLLGTTGTGG